MGNKILDLGAHEIAEEKWRHVALPSMSLYLSDLRLCENLNDAASFYQFNLGQCMHDKSRYCSSTSVSVFCLTMSYVNARCTLS